MTAGSNAVKLTAKTALKNRMLNSIFAATAVIFCTFICYYSASVLSTVSEIIANIVFLALTVFLLLPVFLGLLRFFWRMLFDAYDSPVSVFYYLSDKKLYTKALKFVLYILIRIIGISIIILLPTIAVWLASQGFVYEMLDMPIPIWTANLNNIFVFLRSLSVVLIIFVALKYYIAPVLFVADENIDIDEAVYMSKTISRKTYIDFVFFCFSFIGWFLLSILIIPLIFTLPYMLTSYAVHVRFSIADYNLFIEKNNQNRSYGFLGNFDDEI